MLRTQARGATLLAILGVGLGSAAALSQTIDTCGGLTIDAGCVLFQADTGGIYVLDNASGFTTGDRIHVVGSLNPACVPICSGTIGCITVTLVSPCQTQYSACGMLVQAGACMLFEADPGGTYVLDQTGTFVAGDRVQISGTLNPTCVDVCQPSNGCIAVSSIVACGSPFSSCGVLVQRGTCVVFVADQGGTYVLDTLGGFTAGERVRVAGTLDLTCVRLCQPTDGCVQADAVSACGTSFSGCGTLIPGSGCILFAADVGGTYALANVGNFAAGDHVRVTGALGGLCVTTCTSGVACIADNTIAACATTFSGCGTLFQGVECVLFRADDGSVYILDNLGSFVAGDRVRVVGTLDPVCLSICQQGNGCIQGNTITAGQTVCPGGPVPICPAVSTTLLALSVLGLLRWRRAG